MWKMHVAGKAEKFPTWLSPHGVNDICARNGLSDRGVGVATWLFVALQQNILPVKTFTKGSHLFR